MITIIGVLLAAVLASLSALHVYWAFGGRWGSTGVFPTRPDGDIFTFTPPPIATFVVAAALLCATLLVLCDLALIRLPIFDTVAPIAVWGLAAVFAIRAIGEFKYVGLFKRVRNTEFGRKDTYFYSPLCVAISLSALLVAIG